MLDTRPSAKEVTNMIIKTCQNYDLEPIGVKCYLCSCIGHIARDCKKFVVIMDKNAIVEKADRKKYKVGKRVHINPKNMKINRIIRK